MSQASHTEETSGKSLEAPIIMALPMASMRQKNPARLSSLWTKVNRLCGEDGHKDPAGQWLAQVN